MKAKYLFAFLGLILSPACDQALAQSGSETGIATPDWRLNTAGEPNSSQRQPLPTWKPIASTGEITFVVDPRRLKDAPFGGEILLQRADWAMLPTALGGDPMMQSFWNSISQDARGLLQQGDWSHLIPGPNKDRYIYVVSSLLPRLALLYAATGQPDLGRLVRQLVLDLANRPAPFWTHAALRAYNPQRTIGRIETSDFTESMALTLQWAPDLFTLEERNALRHTIIQKGLNPCLRWLDAPESKNNFIAVIAGGSLGAAMILGDHAGAQQAEHSLEAWLGLIQADGSYSEPEGYLEFGLDSLFSGWWALGREEGKHRLQDSALRNTLRLMAGYYVLHRSDEPAATEPYRVNFGDDDFKMGVYPLPVDSLAYIFDDGLGTWMATHLKSVDRQISLYDFLFRLGAVRNSLPIPRSPQSLRLPAGYLQDNGVAILRSGWTFDRDVVFALRSGGGRSTNFSHDRPNRNAFLLFVDGENMLPAPGRSSYRSPLRTSWDMRTTSQNTISIDGHDQKVHPEAVVSYFKNASDFAVIESDATNCYNDAKRVVRRVWYIRQPDRFVIMDVVELARPATVTWNLLLSKYEGKSEIVIPAESTIRVARSPKEGVLVDVHATQPLAVASADGVMHSVYSYFAGSPEEGRPGSALKRTWTTTRPVSEVTFWTLIVPKSSSSAKPPEFAVDPISGNPKWVFGNDQGQREQLTINQQSLHSAAIRTMLP